jgi:hypothetical protein
MVHKIFKKVLRRFGLELASSPMIWPPEMTDLDRSTIQKVRPYTMTSQERLIAFITAIKYIHKAGIPGDIVECGVWRGGSMMAAALTLINIGDHNRSLYLYDTFEGMPEPASVDINLFGGSAVNKRNKMRKEGGSSEWCYASIEEVKHNLKETDFAENRLFFIKGKVEDTIPSTLPSRIAILRLDTDLYESTRHALHHLYPLLTSGGILILDDYGHWQGCKLAADEYFEEQNINVYLHVIDYTGRSSVKP